MENYYSDNPSLKHHLNNPEMKRIVDLRENNYVEKDKFDFAPLDFEDAMDSYDKVVEIIGEICAETLAPAAEDTDHNGPQLINNEVHYAKGTALSLEKLNDAGLFGIALPRKYGGLNLSIVPYVMAAEIVSRADAAFANIWGLQDCAETILEFASEDQKERFLPRVCAGETMAMDLTEPDAGSDLQAVQLKATQNEKGEWYLNGVKRFITNGDADIALVLARSEEGTKDGRGLSLFIYDRKSNAVKVRRIENKLGIKGSPTCELVFENAPAELLGERRMGLIKYVMSLMNGARLGVGAQSVGICEAAYREALKYAHEREQFGKAIIQFPAVYEILSVMQAKTEASRSLLYETARMVDIYKCYNAISEERKLEPEERNIQRSYNKKADMLTPILKLMSSEYCNQNAYDAIQIFGGTGYMKDFPVERIYRDARITTIYEGTSQLQVVAAIRGVGNGQILSIIKEYEEREIPVEFSSLREKLIALTEQYVKSVATAQALENADAWDFLGRRMVEMAANIIMAYLLLFDAARNDYFVNILKVFMNMIEAQNMSSARFIENFKADELDYYRK
ncbi:acyl-CoA dehydrogenase family protein [Odoribacter sp. OttesenSCG-928-L07]|nr:acyl-CoA dehydrogenase family protein [Odoribacter sp. OttesenSCG-928-L07]MDL2238982.1 acyl-CoA dehydrogenase family protein [Bacteroidales bacterium OttesenSCG-928-L14]MDL2240865.1 acyl-CoA dehydrogenase family protein [Bacteroidales bacterium OttesenSCG-928-K22]